MGIGSGGFYYKPNSCCFRLSGSSFSACLCEGVGCGTLGSFPDNKSSIVNI